MTDRRRMPLQPQDTRVGWIGTGVMGQAMCGHLLAAGFPISVFTRTREKAESLLDAGATWGDSPAAVAQTSDIVITMVGYPADVREVVLGDEGVLPVCTPGDVVIDMTTSEPSLAVEIGRQARERGCHALDAPVSGGDVGARNATLSIMIGGDREVSQWLEPLWQTLGQTIVWQGDCGAGQHTKMVNQTLIATNMIGVCEALLYAYRAGLDLETVMRSVSSGAAGSWSLSNLAPRIIDDNFDPGFFVEHFIKDMGIALQEAHRMQLALPGLSLAKQLYEAVAAQGYARRGTHALQLALASLSGVDWTGRST